MPRDEDREGSRIKVVDRRKFTAEGERREDRPGAESLVAGPPRASTPRTEPDRAAAADTAELDFIAFLQSLYVGALIALGEAANPVTQEVEANLDLARQNIDILVLLEQKTHGNLTPQEHDFMAQVIPYLQMLYVKKAG